MNSSSALRIERVESDQQTSDFFALPQRLYQNDSAYVRPLSSMARLQVDARRHPFYQHASRELWVCYRDRQVVGRVAAIKDDLHNDYHSDSIGFFGLFESIEDQQVADLLLATAAKWLNENGCTSMRGPVNPSMKGEFGVLVDGNEHPPYVMTGHSQKVYDRLLIDGGCELAKQFYAYRIEPHNDQAKHKIRFDRLQRAEAKIMRRYPQLHFKSVDKHSFEQTLRDINELGNVVRRHGFGFVPLTEPELTFMIQNLRRVIRFDMIHVAYWEDQLVGFIVNIPDINWVLSKTIGGPDWLRMIQIPLLSRFCPRSRVIALGVHEDFRKKGIAIMLIKRLTDIAHRFKEWELSWVAEDNMKSTGAIGSVIDLDRYKTWRLYEKAI
jgi:GNAT superfamily N-acetyltransferase